MRRISSFDPKDCNIAVAQQAKYYIENYSMSQIRDVSAGAATFYGWVSFHFDLIIWHRYPKLGIAPVYIAQ